MTQQTVPQKAGIGGNIFWLAYLTISVWVILFLVVNNQADMDLWGVMSFGALLDQNPGRFPYVDPFSYTAKGFPWVYHEWGSGVIFYQFFKYGGSQALFWLKLLLVEVILVLSCHHYMLGGWSRLKDLKTRANRYAEAFYALCLPIVVYLLLPNVSTTVRCQLFSFMGFALFLFLLKRHSQGRMTFGVWLIPLLMLLWANIHGGFIVGLGLLGLYLLTYWFSNNIRKAETLAVVLFLSTLATMTNPYGFRFWETMVSAWALPREHISEWGNVMSLHIPAYGELYTALCLLGVGLGIVQWKRAKERFPLGLILLFFTGAYGWLHYKLSPLYLIALLSYGLDTLQDDLGFLATRFPALWSRVKVWVNRLLPVFTVWLPTALLVFGIFLNAFYWQNNASPLQVRVPAKVSARPTKNPATQFAYPVGVTNYMLRNKIHGNVWVPFSWGEFLLWVLYPQCRISIDGRYETLYNAQIFNAYHRFYHPPYPIEEAERYPTTYILVETTRPMLVQKLLHSPHWHAVYRDEQSVLFSRHPGPLEIGHVPQYVITLDQYRDELNRFKVFVDF